MPNAVFDGDMVEEIVGKITPWGILEGLGVKSGVAPAETEAISNFGGGRHDGQCGGLVAP